MTDLNPQDRNKQPEPESGSPQKFGPGESFGNYIDRELAKLECKYSDEVKVFLGYQTYCLDQINRYAARETWARKAFKIVQRASDESVTAKAIPLIARDDNVKEVQQSNEYMQLLTDSLASSSKELRDQVLMAYASMVDHGYQIPDQNMDTIRDLAETGDYYANEACVATDLKALEHLAGATHVDRVCAKSIAIAERSLDSKVKLQATHMVGAYANAQEARRDPTIENFLSHMLKYEKIAVLNEAVKALNRLVSDGYELRAGTLNSLKGLAQIGNTRAKKLLYNFQALHSKH